jgi:hypothetical protein
LGHDQFVIVERTLARRFSVYLSSDTNAKPAGGTREIDYRLKAGEAGWVLKPTKRVKR